MKRKIFAGMTLLITLSLVLSALGLSFAFYRQFSDAARDDLRGRALLLRDGGFDLSDAQALSGAVMSAARITLIAPDGNVLFDSQSDAETMENHSARAEVRAALENGAGESRRFSDTVGEETIYYAVRLSDGSVLRLAETEKSIFALFGGALAPVIVAILITLIFCEVLAGRLTRRIIAPLAALPDGDAESAYDELAPVLRTIARQREHIAAQLNELRERTETEGAIMENMTEGVVMLGKEGRILSINRAAAAIFGAETDMRGRGMLQLTRDLELLNHASGALQGSRGEMSLEHGGRTYRAYCSPSAGSGALLLFLDITERAYAETMRREFAANVSHELKTPLTSICAAAEMLAGGMVRAQDTDAFYARIKTESSRLIALIDDIIKISRLDEGAALERLESVDMASLAAEVAKSLEESARTHEVTLAVTGGGTVRGVRPLMYEMLYNLADNAVKYNVPGGSAEIAVRREGDCAVITVTDSGIGIPEEAQQRVFERFYRVDASRSKKTGGTGLGLAIVKHIVASAGGEIRLKSRLREGTAITVILPDARG